MNFLLSSHTACLCTSSWRWWNYMSLCNSSSIILTELELYCLLWVAFHEFHSSRYWRGRLDTGSQASRHSKTAINVCTNIISQFCWSRKTILSHYYIILTYGSQQRSSQTKVVSYLSLKISTLQPHWCSCQLTLSIYHHGTWAYIYLHCGTCHRHWYNCLYIHWYCLGLKFKQCWHSYQTSMLWCVMNGGGWATIYSAGS